MKQRSPLAVFFLGFIPFYSIYWYVVTGREMRAQGADLPTAWLLIVPLANIWWLYKFGAAVEHVTHKKTGALLAFIVLWFLGSIGQAIIQDGLNKVDPAPMMGGGTAPALDAPVAPMTTPVPEVFVAPVPQTAPTLAPAPPEVTIPAPSPEVTMPPSAYTPPAPTAPQPPIEPQQPPTGPINV